MVEKDSGQRPGFCGMPSGEVAEGRCGLATCVLWHILFGTWCEEETGGKKAEKLD